VLSPTKRSANSYVLLAQKHLFAGLFFSKNAIFVSEMANPELVKKLLLAR